MVGTRSSCSGFLLGLGVIILLLVKDSNAFSNIQGMKKLEAPIRKDCEAKKEIIGDASKDSGVALQHGRINFGGRKIMIDIKNQQREASKAEKSMPNVQEGSKSTDQRETSNSLSTQKLESEKLLKAAKEFESLLNKDYPNKGQGRHRSPINNNEPIN